MIIFFFLSQTFVNSRMDGWMEGCMDGWRDGFTTEIFVFLCTRSSASVFLEKQIQKVDGVVSGFEEQLAKDAIVLDKPNALQTCNQQLQVL